MLSYKKNKDPNHAKNNNFNDKFFRLSFIYIIQVFEKEENFPMMKKISDI
jgi:hypothetical protein